MAVEEVRSQDNQVAGDVSSKQAVEPKKADNVGASGGDAQHNEQRLYFQRVDRGRRCFRAWSLHRNLVSAMLLESTSHAYP